MPTARTVSSKQVIKAQGIAQSKKMIGRRSIQPDAHANVDLLGGSDSKRTSRIDELTGNAATRMIGDIFDEQVGT